MGVRGHQRASTVWDILIDSDDEAYDAFQLVVGKERVEAFLDDDNVIHFPRRRR